MAEKKDYEALFREMHPGFFAQVIMNGIGKPGQAGPHLVD